MSFSSFDYIRITLLWLCLLGSCNLAQGVAAALTPVLLRCDSRENPLGIDCAQPMLAWQLQAHDGNARGLRQHAYQILVSSTPELLANGKGDLWDSGKVTSTETYAIPYRGTTLQASQRVFWKVRVWDQDRTSSAWSAGAEWTMGLLTAEEWSNARWVALPDTNVQSQLLRREFVVRAGLVRAVGHVSGLGHYEFSLNGRKAGIALLTPGWTDYRKTVLYDTYDFTSLLHQGTNVAGITLGNGMYSVEKTRGRYNKFAGSMGSPKAIALLRLEYADGSHEIIVTDTHWQAHSGPITYCNVYGGEDYDARLALKLWNHPGFDASLWPPAVEVASPGGRLTGLSGAGWPIQAIETITPIKRTALGSNVVVFDLGQNAPIIPRLAVSGAPGAIVKIIPAELIKPAGEIDDTTCGGKSFWTYTLAGETNEIWQPQFFYRGARYLQVELQPAAPDGALPEIIALTGIVVHAAAPTSGEFSTSSDLFNRIFTLVRWAQRGNMMSVLTDCPQREKLGWLEQDYLNGPALRYNFNLNPLFNKIVRDINDAQLPNGLVPNIAPEYTVFGWWADMQFRESPEWGSAFIQIPWQQYLFTGDLDLARRHYENLKTYLLHLEKNIGPDGILRIKGSLGDWYDIGPKPPGKAQLTPIDLTATAIYHDDLLIMAALAEAMNRSSEARQFRKKANRTSVAFNREYFNSTNGVYATGSQTANAMPLAFGMVAAKHHAGVLAAIIADVERHGLTAGDVGYRYLLRALADGGQSDVVFNLNHQTEKPGYGYQLKMGATSLTEAWDARRASSQNHFMLGQINEWFFHDLAGIQPDTKAPGFKSIVIKPAIVGDLTWVKADYDSVRGRITSEWKRDGRQLTLNVSIPPNTTGTVHLPTANVRDITENGVRARASSGVKLLHTEESSAVFSVKSGNYSFTTLLPMRGQR